MGEKQGDKDGVFFCLVLLGGKQLCEDWVVLGVIPSPVQD